MMLDFCLVEPVRWWCQASERSSLWGGRKSMNCDLDPLCLIVYYEQLVAYMEPELRGESELGI